MEACDSTRRRVFHFDPTEVGQEDGYILKNKEVAKAMEKTNDLYPAMFKDDRLTYGEVVKGKSEVLMEHSKGSRRVTFIVAPLVEMFLFLDYCYHAL
ncbi:uncharacterized protein LOC110737503 isoform X2 [Chenopodium quinoa]|uniref:uncharacterized protein LOC110737503 isoform X2 n=1 Tax=Chenopodium quinoa TaxID=63459 RepID=UPI000B794B75|nr:uncharacterized protein LOC110737503 isoform X2 [Chenopodium quinoa]